MNSGRAPYVRVAWLSQHVAIFEGCAFLPTSCAKYRIPVALMPLSARARVRVCERMHQTHTQSESDAPPGHIGARLKHQTTAVAFRAGFLTLVVESQGRLCEAVLDLQG